MQIVPTLGPKVYKYYLLWAFWSPRERKKSHVRALTKGRVVVERAVYILSYRDLLEGLMCFSRA